MSWFANKVRDFLLPPRELLFQTVLRPVLSAVIQSYRTGAGPPSRASGNTVKTAGTATPMLLKVGRAPDWFANTHFAARKASYADASWVEYWSGWKSARAAFIASALNRIPDLFLCTAGIFWWVMLPDLKIRSARHAGTASDRCR